MLSVQSILYCFYWLCNSFPHVSFEFQTYICQVMFTTTLTVYLTFTSAELMMPEMWLLIRCWLKTTCHLVLAKWNDALFRSRLMEMAGVNWHTQICPLMVRSPKTLTLCECSVRAPSDSNNVPEHKQQTHWQRPAAFLNVKKPTFINWYVDGKIVWAPHKHFEFVLLISRCLFSVSQ